jgi:hypothetical protein
MEIFKFPPKKGARKFQGSIERDILLLRHLKIQISIDFGSASINRALRVAYFPSFKTNIINKKFFLKIDCFWCPKNPKAVDF